MLRRLISEFYVFVLLIVAIVDVIIAALAFTKLRKWCNLEYNHCCVVILIIAAILYLISDGSETFIFYATFQVFTLRFVSDIIFIPHLVKRRVEPKYTKEAILHFIYTLALFIIYFMLLKADDKHILYMIFS